MAGIDKTYVTWEEYQEIVKFFTKKVFRKQKIEIFTKTVNVKVMVFSQKMGAKNMYFYQWTLLKLVIN